MTARKPAKTTSAQRSTVFRKAVPASAKPSPKPAERAENPPVALRFEELPPDVGWVLVYVGVLGVILPGIPGLPFVIAGGAVLLPGGPQLLDRWVGQKAAAGRAREHEADRPFARRPGTSLSASAARPILRRRIFPHTIHNPFKSGTKP